VIFLGQPREEKLQNAHDASLLERIGLAWLAAGSIALGLFPIQAIDGIDRVTRLLIAHRPGDVPVGVRTVCVCPGRRRRCSRNSGWPRARRDHRAGPLPLLGGR
jgi:hypothetical protein